MSSAFDELAKMYLLNSCVYVCALVCASNTPIDYHSSFENNSSPQKWKEKKNDFFVTCRAVRVRGTCID